MYRLLFWILCGMLACGAGEKEGWPAAWVLAGVFYTLAFYPGFVYISKNFPGRD